MPDLLTHALAGHVLYRLSPVRLDYSLVMVGTLLPDLVSWLPLNVYLKLELPLELPSDMERYFPPMHSPVLSFLWAAFFALLFVPSQRSMALRSLLWPAMLHILLDAFQLKFDSGYLLLYPLAMRRVQIGLVPQDDWHLWIAAGCASVIACEAWLWSRRR